MDLKNFRVFFLVDMITFITQPSNYQGLLKFGHCMRPYGTQRYETKSLLKKQRVFMSKRNTYEITVDIIGRI